MEKKFIDAFREALEIVENQNISMEDVFRDYPQWDSMSHMSLIAMLDMEFSIQIENAVFEKMKTVQDIFNYVRAHAVS